MFDLKTVALGGVAIAVGTYYLRKRALSPVMSEAKVLTAEASPDKVEQKVVDQVMEVPVETLEQKRKRLAAAEDTTYRQVKDTTEEERLTKIETSLKEGRQPAILDTSRVASQYILSPETNGGSNGVSLFGAPLPSSAWAPHYVRTDTRDGNTTHYAAESSWSRLFGF